MEPQYFRLDGSYRRPDDGDVVIGGSPLRLFRLTAAGRRVAAAIERQAPLPVGHATLTDRFLDAGAIHPVWDDDGLTTEAVTVVVPALDLLPEAKTTGVTTIVVDDGSRVPLVSSDPATVVIRLARNSGPGAARNAGLAEVRTPLVAFVDTDVELADGWLHPLLAHFADPRVALVAPRVRSAAGGCAAIDAYESLRGSLDLGPVEARIAPGSRVGYVPAAAIVCRADAVRAVGGFDPGMRFGEDVDLVWRLHEAGWRCRYQPASVVTHRARAGLGRWARQRYDYGTSAAPLAARHPGALAPLRVSGWSAAVWGLVAIRRPFAAGVVAAGTIVALQSKLRGVPAAESARLAGLGHLHAGEQVASAVTRTWWPLAIAAGTIVRRLRFPLAAAALVPPTLEWFRRSVETHGRRRVQDLVNHVLIRLADDVSYGAGVWSGVLRRRDCTALRPDLTNWPPRLRTSAP